MQKVFMLTLSILLSQALCFADSSGCSVTKQPPALDRQAQYQALRAKLFSDCDNVDKALKEAAPIIDQLNIEVAAAHRSEAAYIKAKNAKANNADLNRIVLQYKSHCYKVKSLGEKYLNKIKPAKQALDSDEEGKLFKLFPSDQYLSDTQLMDRLRSTVDSIVTPLVQVIYLWEPIKSLIIDELCEQRVNPATLTKQRLAKAVKPAIQTLLDEESVESNLSEVTEQNFEVTVKNSKIPVLLYFGVPWSKECKLFVPQLIQAAQKYKGQVSIVRVSLINSEPIYQHYNVSQYYPTIILLAPWKAPIVKAGPDQCANLNTLIDSALNTSSPAANQIAKADSVLEVTDQSFQETVKNSKLPVLVDISADWCGPCKMLAPELVKVAKQYQGKLTVVRVDVDQNPGIKQAFNVEAIPTILIFVPGQDKPVVHIGYLDYADLTSFIDTALKPVVP